ncbi:hypothetical protein DL762_004064 [Monosporascus cannonballus]|uniref:Uncharacterized protein n=1 Tax=Monosporascus cannonballus TaxID=155416 RepID=A0ABY0H992_9PEZI|nr:hypothetical protein DL762_004064 [Monosporascus cannonballus]
MQQDDVGSDGDPNPGTPSCAQPILDDSTTWEQLPQIELKDLEWVRVPRPQKYGKGEVAVDNSLVINLDDLLRGKLRNESVIRSIIESNEHIRTLSLVAQARSLSEQLRTWAIKQEIDIDGFRGSGREDVEDAAQGSLAQITATIHGPSSSRILETRRFTPSTKSWKGSSGRASVSTFSLTGFASLIRTLFGDHTKALQPKLAVSVELLAETPLISTDTLLLMRKLGANFDWIDNQANSALAVFLHHLSRYQIEYSSAAHHFEKLVALIKPSKVFRDPADASPCTVENLVKLLPPRDQPLTSDPT